MREISSLQPFAYMGVEPQVTPDLIKETRRPTSADRKNRFLGDMWLNTSTGHVYILTKIVGNTATWKQLVNAGIIIDSYVTDSGTVVPDSSASITLEGDDFFVSTSGSGNELTLSMIARGDNGQLIIGASGGSAAWKNLSSTGGTMSIVNTANSVNIEISDGAIITLTTDTGATAIPASQDILLSGGTNIGTSAVGNVVTFAVDSNITLSGTLTQSALGAGVVKTSGAGLWSSTNGEDGQLLIGGGAAPIWANITSADTSLTITNTDNAIDLQIPALPPAESYTFEGYNAFNLTGSAGTGGGSEMAINFNSENFDIGGCFYTTTFTAQSSGKYYLYFLAQLEKFHSTGGYYWRCFIKVNGVYYIGTTMPTNRKYVNYNSSTNPLYGTITGHAFCLVEMTEGQTASAYIQSWGGIESDGVKGTGWSTDYSKVPPMFVGYLVSNI